MDRVRFGRALGYGARHAVKSLAQAVDAATSPDPKAAANRKTLTQRVAQTHQTAQQSKVQAAKLGRSVWSPLAKFSGVLWLQVTGTFFALIAAYLSQGLWTHRGDAWHGNSPDGQKFYVHIAAFAVFTYFAVSSFMRAHKRERR